MRICTIFIVLLVAGCVRSSVVPIGEDTYLLTRSEKTLGAASVREAAVEDAREYCASKGMNLEILGASEKPMVFLTSDPESEVTFKCIDESAEK